MKKRVSGSKGESVCRRAGILYFAAAILLVWSLMPASVQAAGKAVQLPGETLMMQGADLSGTDGEVNLTEMFSGAKEKVKEALEQIDQKTAKEMFDFVQEKIADGSLKTEGGLKAAIEEGEKKFGVTIDEATARNVVDTMEKLEAMGFSGEELVKKAKNLYEKYGADFIEHANEAITEAVEDAVADATQSFFSNLWEGTKNFFRNLMSGF